jgi:hypothetical protein
MSRAEITRIRVAAPRSVQGKVQQPVLGPPQRMERRLVQAVPEVPSTSSGSLEIFARPRLG